ncbi:hypothetical protein [Sinorhizobium prairiense]|uniref:hypothetical protein n=1 Tax=unclassified Sinorhizobium TaxID=2613772 RepID=UPI0023D8320A|nr:MULTISPECIES: hypothetical protein [unclassified Sinorhizobium]WEJ08442.1 hypothetical protein N0Q90_01755 [Sinorhizobium sp. M103]WEJ14053.1 hypothetical protein N0Q91_00955 [Sinorhizobium sp. K101]WEJ35654.1 hypothetical protein N0R80_00955 [Sinorhizobium sp. C101]
MNPFLVFPVPQELPRRPDRLYAKLDDVMEDVKKSRNELLLGAIDADWFDRPDTFGLLGRGDTRLRAIAVAPIFFLEIDVFGQAGGPWIVETGDRVEEDRWVEIRIAPSGDSRLYRNLYGDPEPVSVLSAHVVSTQKSDALNEMHSLDEWAIPDDDFDAHIASLKHPKIERLAVYDVGQGSANGFSEAICIPRLYFDFGGGSRSHTKTRPHAIPHFCLSAPPVMVLSHWHDDHWSSGPIVTRSLSLTWIAPFQSVTSPHLAFAASIVSAGGRLLVTRVASFSFGNALFHHATGTSRNDSGYWVQVNPPKAGKPFFFPADASYQHIGPRAPLTLQGIAATHHGGDWKNAVLPPSAGGTVRCRSVFSFGLFPSGASNTYGHPTTRSVADHNKAGFVQLDTPLRTGGKSGNGTGHVHLDWSGTRIPSAPCGNSVCYQNLDQA